MFWWWWALAGYALGQESGREDGREEGIEEAKRRINGDSGNGRPRVHRKQGGPPPPPPTRSQWLMAVILGALIFGVALLIEDGIFGSGGNYTADDYPQPDGIISFANLVVKVFRLGLFLASFIPLASTASQWFASQTNPEGENANFRFTGKEGEGQ